MIYEQEFLDITSEMELNLRDVTGTLRSYTPRHILHYLKREGVKNKSKVGEDKRKSI